MLTHRAEQNYNEAGSVVTGAPRKRGRCRRETEAGLQECLNDCTQETATLSLVNSMVLNGNTLAISCVCFVRGWDERSKIHHNAG